MKPIGLCLVLLLLLSTGLVVEGGGGWFGGDSDEVKELKNIIREINRRNSELTTENSKMEVSITYLNKALKISQEDLSSLKKMQEQCIKTREVQMIQKINLDEKDAEIDTLKIDVENVKTELRKAEEEISKLVKDLNKKEAELYRLKKDVEVSKTDLIRTQEEGSRRSTELAERKEEYLQIRSNDMALLQTIWETGEKNRNLSDKCLDILDAKRGSVPSPESSDIVPAIVAVCVGLGTAVCIQGYLLHSAHTIIGNLTSASPRRRRSESPRPRTKARETVEAAQTLRKMQNGAD